jgi:hypothetical protein
MLISTYAARLPVNREGPSHVLLLVAQPGKTLAGKPQE